MPKATEYLWDKHLLCARARSLHAPGEAEFLQVSSSVSLVSLEI